MAIPNTKEVITGHIQADIIIDFLFNEMKGA